MIPPNVIQSMHAVRSGANPLITPSSSQTLGNNINGPSVIRVPAWIQQPLGKYYMYFAHHEGQYIRLAYADALDGPWRIHEPGALHLEQASAFRGHIASPDVHLDEERRQIRMYFHGQTHARERQWTGVATSSDGLNFAASGELLGRFYFRVWRLRGAWYALAKDGQGPGCALLRSDDGLGPFERRGLFLEGSRHVATLVRGDTLLLFYSRTGDAPERIVVSTVDLRPDWLEWRASEAVEVLSPDTDYEGVQFPIEPSLGGAATNVCQLRDPCVYEEGSSIFLFYSIAGETGIAMARLTLSLAS